MQLLKQILRPWISQILFQDPCEMFVSARSGKSDLKHMSHLVEIQEFIVDPALLGIGSGRTDTNNVGRNGDRTDITHDRDALVSFFNIERIQEFIDFDRIPDPFLDL